MKQDALLAEQAAKATVAKETGEVIPPLSSAAITQAPAKTSHSEMGATTYRDLIEIQIVSPDLVPRDLCEPSPTKIRARANSGIREIPGVIITVKQIPVSRAG